MSLDSPAWLTSLLRPTAIHVRGRGIFPRRFQHRPSWPGRAPAPRLASRQTSASRRTSSVVPGTFRSAQARKPFWFERAHSIRARSRMPSPQGSSARLQWRNSRLWRFSSAFVPFGISSPEARGQKSAPDQRNWECAAYRFLRSLSRGRSGFRSSSLCILREWGRPRWPRHSQSFPC